MIPIQNQPLAQLQLAITEQKSINRSIIKWKTAPYSQSPTGYPIFFRSQVSLQNSAEVSELVDGTSILVPVPPNYAALPAAQRNLIDSQRRLFQLKSKGIMNLLERSFKENADGWTDREPCDIDDGLTAWTNIVAKQNAQFLRSNGSLRQTFMSLIQLKDMTFSEFVSQLRLHRNACNLDPNQAVTDNDCRNTCKKGFRDPTHDGRIKRRVQHVYLTLDFDGLVTEIEDELADYDTWSTTYANRADTANLAHSGTSASQPNLCSHCNKKYHTAEQCWTKHPELIPEDVKARWAKRDANRDKQKKQSKSAKANKATELATLQQTTAALLAHLQGQTASSAQSSSTALVTTKTGTKHLRDDPFCIYCGKDNHWSAYCPISQQHLATMNKQQKTQQSSSAAAAACPPDRRVTWAGEDDNDSDTSRVIISEVVLSFFQSLPPRAGYIIVMLDTGTSCYICVDRSAFKCILPDPYHRLETADAATHTSSGVGTVSFFSGVRLYPGLVCNLWSPGKMMEDGWQLSFAANGDIRANHSNANFQTLVFTFNQTTKLWYGYLPLSEISSVEMVNSHTPTSM